MKKYINHFELTSLLQKMSELCLFESNVIFF